MAFATNNKFIHKLKLNFQSCVFCRPDQSVLGKKSNSSNELKIYFIQKGIKNGAENVKTL